MLIFIVIIDSSGNSDKYKNCFSKTEKIITFAAGYGARIPHMVPIVQLVRASDCGSECRGFESHLAPKKQKKVALQRLFCFMGAVGCKASSFSDPSFNGSLREPIESRFRYYL